MANEIVLYKPNEQFQLEVQVADETVWLSQQQMVILFDSTKQNISLHINNIFKEGELNKEATVKEYLTVQTEGGRQVTRKVFYYNLDVIISVGYRVKSQRGTQFRRWATKIIRDYTLRGYAVNQREHKNLRDMHNADNSKQPVNTHKWSQSSHDRWVIIDDTLYHCGHSVKDLGKKLSAIMRMDWDPETVLKESGDQYTVVPNK